MARRQSLVQARYRFEKGLFRKLEQAAKNNDRSLNDEIAHRLEDSFVFSHDEWKAEREWREERLRLLTLLETQARSRLQIKRLAARARRREEQAN
jgi:hypothetical protein